MKPFFGSLSLLIVVLFGSVNSYVAPKSNLNSQKPSFDLKNAVATAFTAATIASSAFAPMAQAVDFTPSPINFGTSTVIAEKFVREGIYGEYEVDLVQQYDDPRSTFKPAKETKSKKGKYTALLGVLVVGSFIIPMAQYFWYVKDDDSSDRFFAEKVAVPEPPKKKSGFFGKAAAVPEPPKKKSSGGFFGKK